MFGMSGLFSNIVQAKAQRQQAAANWQRAMNDPNAFLAERQRQAFADQRLTAGSQALSPSKFMTPSETLANPFRDEPRTVVRDTGMGWGTVIAAFVLGGIIS